MILDGVSRRASVPARAIPEPIDFCPFSPGMEKVLAVGAATTRLHALKAVPEEAVPPQASQPTSGNAMCPVLCLEMVDFSRRPVADQLVLRERFNGRLARALEQVPLLDRMVLETVEGVAITFLGGPEAALHVALRFAHSLQPVSGSSDPLQVRACINLGHVRLTRDGSGHPLVLGDGINVAQRLLGFAAPGQFLASRAYHEALCQRFPAHKGLFLYQGSRTDTHVREHEVYELDAQAMPPGEVPPPASVQAPRTPAPPSSARLRSSSRRRLAVAGAAISAALLFAAVLDRVLPDRSEHAGGTSDRAVAQPTPLERPLVLRQKTLLPTPAAVRPENSAAGEAPDANLMAEAAAQSHAHAKPEPAASPVTQPPGAHRTPPRASGAPRAAPQAGPSARADDRPRRAASPTPPAQAPAAVSTTTPGPVVAQPGPVGQQAANDAWRMLPTPSLPAPASPKETPTALVLLAVSPWGEVFVDGRSMGVSPPLTELELPQGKHRIVVRNSDFKPYDEEIELGSNQTMRIKHKFVRR